MPLWILDTDHISLYQRGHRTVIDQVISLSPKNLAVTVISIEEQMYGRLNEIKKASSSTSLISSYSRLALTVDYYNSVQVLPFDLIAQQCFKELVLQRIRVGTQDLRIAAIALSVDGTVVSRNHKDFSKVPNLQLENWAIAEV
jgi:tRNA(fMet)-specific endonuclease VapC